jgi:hypothetical protein
MGAKKVSRKLPNRTGVNRTVSFVPVVEPEQPPLRSRREPSSRSPFLERPLLFDRADEIVGHVDPLVRGHQLLFEVVDAGLESLARLLTFLQPL